MIRFKFVLHLFQNLVIDYSREYDDALQVQVFQ